jgi:hypothetical protein
MKKLWLIEKTEKKKKKREKDMLRGPGDHSDPARFSACGPASQFRTGTPFFSLSHWQMGPRCHPSPPAVNHAETEPVQWMPPRQNPRWLRPLNPSPSASTNSPAPPPYSTSATSWDNTARSMNSSSGSTSAAVLWWRFRCLQVTPPPNFGTPLFALLVRIALMHPFVLGIPRTTASTKADDTDA